MYNIYNYYDLRPEPELQFFTTYLDPYCQTLTLMVRAARAVTWNYCRWTSLRLRVGQGQRCKKLDHNGKLYKARTRHGAYIVLLAPKRACAMPRICNKFGRQKHYVGTKFEGCSRVPYTCVGSGSFSSFLQFGTCQHV